MSLCVVADKNSTWRKGLAAHFRRMRIRMQYNSELSKTRQTSGRGVCVLVQGPVLHTDEPQSFNENSLIGPQGLSVSEGNMHVS